MALQVANNKAMHNTIVRPVKCSVFRDHNYPIQLFVGLLNRLELTIYFPLLF